MMKLKAAARLLRQTVYALLAEHRQRLFPDEMFADLFGSGRGRPSVPADVIATVMILQQLEGLSDRDAIEALRADLRWKVAAGLALDDEGFHPTVLTLWRNKLRASSQPQRIFDAVRALMNASGALAGKTRRVLDSTVLVEADRVESPHTVERRVRSRHRPADQPFGRVRAPPCAIRFDLPTGRAVASRDLRHECN